LVRYGDSESSSPTGWHPLSEPLIWSGTETEALQPQSLPQTLNPSWKVMLLSDGSVTRHLQLMTGLQVNVQCLEMKNIGEERDGLPPAAVCMTGGLLQRQVFLRLPDPLERSYVYAASWWNAKTINTYLR